ILFQAEDGIRDRNVTGVQTCALPILRAHGHAAAGDAALAQARDWLAGRSAAEAASEEHRLRVALVSYIAGRLADAQRQFQLLAEIGRASCRERVEITEVQYKLKQKK